MSNRIEQRLQRITRAGAALAVALALPFMTPAPVRAQDPSTASQGLSALSMLPLASVTVVASVGAAGAASLVALPAVLLSSASDWLIVSAQASAHGTAWLLERSSDGLRIAARFATGTADGMARLSRFGAGQRLSLTPVAGGWLVGAGTEAIAFVPRQADRALFHHERLY